jgi:hypothetical protein
MRAGPPRLLAAADPGAARVNDAAQNTHFTEEKMGLNRRYTRRRGEWESERVDRVPKDPCLS